MKDTISDVRLYTVFTWIQDSPAYKMSAVHNLFQENTCTKMSTLCMIIRWPIFFRWRIRQKNSHHIFEKTQQSHIYLCYCISDPHVLLGIWTKKSKNSSLNIMLYFLEWLYKGVYGRHSINNSMIVLAAIFDEQMAVLGVWPPQSQDSICAIHIHGTHWKTRLCETSKGLI